jgi:hypothetical protein
VRPVQVVAALLRAAAAPEQIDSVPLVLPVSEQLSEAMTAELAPAVGCSVLVELPLIDRFLPSRDLRSPEQVDGLP